MNKSTEVELCQGLSRMVPAEPAAPQDKAELRVAQEGTQLEERRGQEWGRRNQPVFLHRARRA